MAEFAKSGMESEMKNENAKDLKQIDGVLEAVPFPAALMGQAKKKKSSPHLFSFCGHAARFLDVLVHGCSSV